MQIVFWILTFLACACQGALAVCSAGTYLYTSGTGSTVCRSCPANSQSSSGATVCTANTGYYDLGSNIIAYYPFNPNDFTSDITGKTGSVTNTGGITSDLMNWTTAWSGQGAYAANFSQPGGTAHNTNNQYLSIPSMTIPQYFSICLWYYPLTIQKYTNLLDFFDSFRHIWGAQRSASPTQWLYFRLDGSIVGNLIYYESFGNYNSWNLGQWNHLCLIVSPTMYYEVINSVVLSSISTTSINPINFFPGMTTSGAYLGYSTSSNLADATPNYNFMGYLDEVRIFNTAITLDEVAALYNFRGDTYTAVMPLMCPSGGCTFCQPGTYSADGQSNCVPCAANTFSAAARLTSCSNCSAGTYSFTGQSACTGCGAGKYSLGNTCQPCGIGTYFTGAGATACTPCPAGTFSTGTGITYSSVCTYCQAGTYTTDPGNGGNCTQCAAGTYNTGVGNMVGLPSQMYADDFTPELTQHTAPIGHRQRDQYCSSYQYTPYLIFSPAVTSLYNICYLDDFRSGKCPWSAGSSCYVAQTYYDYVLMQMVSQVGCSVGCVQTTTCTNIYNGTFLPNTGSFDGIHDVAPNSCLIQCNPGFMLSDNYCVPQPTCLACPAGTYNTVNGSSSCTPCPSCPIGQYNPGCTLTTAGSCAFCPSCPAGYYSPTCFAADLSLKLPAATPCAQCPAGMYSPVNASACVFCPYGKYTLSDADRTCVSCGAGTYSSTVGASNSATCTTCPSGLFAGIASSACSYCLAGTYILSSTNSTCTSCGAGTFSTVAGATSADACLQCLPGTFSNGTSSSACSNCQAGAYSLNATTCALCRAGTYSTTVGALTSAACTLCALGMYTTGTGIPASSACTYCQPGTYAASPGSGSACTNCAPQTFSATGGSFEGQSTPNPTGNPYSSHSAPVAKTPGYYCSLYQPNQQITLTSNTIDLSSPSLGNAVACYPAIQPFVGTISPNICQWTSFPYCQTAVPQCSVNIYTLINICASATVGCVGGCVQASPCINGANGTFTATNSTFDGVTDIAPDSCPVQCNPGFILSNNYCVPRPPCSPCQSCTNGYKLSGCSGANPGQCLQCTNN